MDDRVVRDFGREWGHFTQSNLSLKEQEEFFRQYFAVFPWDRLPEGARGFDLGCGSGRWAKFVASRVGALVCVDPSERALEVARENLSGHLNCEFVQADVGELPFPAGSMDFGYSLGVLHHVPDTQEGLRVCVAKLKKGAPFLVYLYYAFDNRPGWYWLLWKMTDLLRRGISRLPFLLKRMLTFMLALGIYWPLARAARILAYCGVSVTHWPLKDYQNSTFYTMKTDALDRFGTVLEKRFRKEEVLKMMEEAGLGDVAFAPTLYWTAVGFKR